MVDARGHLVGEETALVLKKLDGQNTDIFERFEDAAGNVFRRALEWRRGGGGRGGGPEGKRLQPGGARLPGKKRNTLNPHQRGQNAHLPCGGRRTHWHGGAS